MPGRRRSLLLTLAAVLVTTTFAAAALGTLAWWNGGLGSLVGRQRCVVSAAGTTLTLSPEQAQQAATITAVTAQRGLPQRAATIALATAMQESKLTNLAHGDRDSAGLFQQRPSQGWGSFRQVTNPRYATDRFLTALVSVPRWQYLPVTVAAQRVQRSAYPDAYRQHATAARALASSLSGRDPASLTCTVHLASLPQQQPGPSGFTARSQRVRDDVHALFPAGIKPLHTGAAIAVRPSPLAAHPQRVGWAVAHWLVANADRLHVTVVAYQGQVWTARRSPDGWQQASGSTSDGSPSTPSTTVRAVIE